jgi:hypothetical protein
VRDTAAVLCEVSDEYFNVRKFLCVSSITCQGRGGERERDVALVGCYTVWVGQTVQRVNCPNVEGGISLLLRNVSKYLPTQKSSDVVCTAVNTSRISHGVQWRTQEFFSEGVLHQYFFRGGGGGQQIQLRTEGRENRDLGAVAPYPRGYLSICKWVKLVFLLGCYGCIFHVTGDSVPLFPNFGISGAGGCWTPPLDTPLVRRLFPPELILGCSSDKNCKQCFRDSESCPRVWAVLWRRMAKGKGYGGRQWYLLQC